MGMTKATMNSRQEETHMMSTADRSFTDWNTLQEDRQLGLSFMQAHGYSPRSECGPPPPLVALGLHTGALRMELPWGLAPDPNCGICCALAGTRPGAGDAEETQGLRLYCALKEPSRDSTDATVFKEQMQSAVV